MKPWVRRLLWGVAIVLGLPLLLGLLWLLLNRIDADPQPWPEALALPANTLPAEDNPLLALPLASSAKGTLALGDCKADADCFALWRTRLTHLAAVRAANPELGLACEAAAAREGLRYEDPMPEPMTIWGPSPRVFGASQCHTWLLSRALDALAAGDAAQTQHWLARADRVDRAVLSGGRSLQAHMVGLAKWHQKLAVLHMAAQQHPQWAAALAPLAVLDGRQLLASQQAWVRVEANYGRVAVDSMRVDVCRGQVEASWFAWWSCTVGAPAAQPEYLTQRFATRWVRVLTILGNADSLPAALPSLNEALLDHAQGWWSQVRHTIPTILDDVAQTAWPGQFERAARVLADAEATHRWLLNPATPRPAISIR